MTYSLPGFLAPVFEFISLGSHYDSVIRGVVDTRDMLYYISFIGLFLFLNVEVLQSRR